MFVNFPPAPISIQTSLGYAAQISAIWQHRVEGASFVEGTQVGESLCTTLNIYSYYTKNKDM